MKHYQVTRKLQVTIPKKLAERTGIKPGDSVVFEDADNDTIILKKVTGPHQDSQAVKLAIDELGKDLARIRSQIRKSESALVENLSRNITSK